MGKFDDLPELRRAGLEKMEQVYGFEMTDGQGDFFRYTADHLFADAGHRLLLVTHDLALARRCEAAVLFDRGGVRAIGEAGAVVAAYEEVLAC